MSKSAQKSSKASKKAKFSLKSPKKTASKASKASKTSKVSKVRKTSKTAKKLPKSSKTPKSPKIVLQQPFELYSRKSLEKSLKIDAKALRIPPGAAEIFIKRTLDAVEKSLKPKQIITEHDLTTEIVKELKKYHPDFAYVYQNRDKIV